MDMDKPKVLLDGKFVDAETVTPDKARFIGMWRPPRDPFGSATADCLCTCGRILRFKEEAIDHYRDGCHDVPQYVSL